MVEHERVLPLLRSAAATRASAPRRGTSAAAQAASGVLKLRGGAKPRLRNPLAKATGVGGALLAAKGQCPLILTAVAAVMAVKFPDALAQVLLELVCYLGSFLKPYESMLPEKGLLRAFVTTVKQAKKAYNIKHGLIDIDDQQFFDDEDEDEDSVLPMVAEVEEEEEFRDPDLGWLVPREAEAEAAAEALDAVEAEVGKEMLDAAVGEVGAEDAVESSAAAPDGSVSDDVSDPRDDVEMPSDPATPGDDAAEVVEAPSPSA